MLTWGSAEEALRTHYKTTGEMPPALQAKPDISPDIGVYITGFFFLHSFRVYTEVGPSPLIFSDVLEYAQLLGYNDGNSLLFFAKVMKACDGEYLRITADRRKAAAAAANARKKSGR